MMLRRAGLEVLVGTVLMASSGAFAGPALLFEITSSRKTGSNNDRYNLFRQIGSL